MKKPLAFLFLAGITCVVFQAFMIRPVPGPGIPDDVKKVLKTSCFDCHSNGAKKKVPKAALNFDKWDDYKLTKRISKLDGICKTVQKDKMPPEKYVDAHPDRALDETQKKLVCDWAGQESAKLMEEIDE